MRQTIFKRDKSDWACIEQMLRQSKLWLWQLRLLKFAHVYSTYWRG